MEDRLRVEDRSFVRQLLQRSFGSAAEAAATICALLREEIGAYVVYCAHVADDRRELAAYRPPAPPTWRPRSAATARSSTTSATSSSRSTRPDG